LWLAISSIVRVKIEIGAFASRQSIRDGDFMFEVVEKIAALGTLVGGLALWVAAAAAWATYAFYYRVANDAAWINRYQVLYGEFWKDPRIAQVRIWISSEAEYAKLANILRERLKSDQNTLGVDENRTLEQIDYFCSVIMQIDFMTRGKMTRRQRELWRMTFGDYWMRKIAERTELRSYIQKYWVDERQTNKRTLRRALD
jgi:hypothetical protein